MTIKSSVLVFLTRILVEKMFRFFSRLCEILVLKALNWVFNSPDDASRRRELQVTGPFFPSKMLQLMT